MQILLVAGEASGDVHAAKVARLLRQQGARIVAVGGTRLQAEGAELVAHVDELSVLGFVEVFRRLPRLVALKRQLEALLRSHRFDLFLPVDFPGLNLRLAATARRAGVPVLHYIGPQVWAWRAGRLRRLRECVDHVALVLPFEKPLYDAAGVPATFVGHPLLDEPPLPEAEPDVDVALFPGSRPQEVERHLPVLLDAIVLLRQSRPQLRFLVSVAPTAPAAWMEARLRERRFETAVQSGAPARHVMQRARALLVAAGTATLEASLAKRPFAVLYRTGLVNYAVARQLVRVPHIALANLVAGETIVREYVQEAATPEALAAELETLLDDAAARQRILDGLARVRQHLGSPGAAARVTALAQQVVAGALAP